MMSADHERRIRDLEAALATLRGAGRPLAILRSSGAAEFALDLSAAGSGVTIANLATAQPFGASNNFGGLILIQETAADGGAGLFLTGGGAITLVADTISIYSNAQGTANRINVYLDASTIVTVENRRGGSRTVNVCAIRSRASN